MPASTTTPVATTTQTEPTTTSEPAVFEYTVDLVELSESAELREPDGTIRLPWGHGVGEAWYSADFGPHSIDVLPDGGIVIVDGYNLRVQVFDGTQWSVLLEFEEDGGLVPYGVAAIDSGLIGIAENPRGSAGLASQTLLLVTPDGEIVDEGRVPVILNAPWSGGQDLWSAFGPGAMPQYWIRLTSGDEVISFDRAALDHLDREIERRISRGMSPYPVELMIDLGYVEVRSDSGIDLQVTGGQGWNNENSLDPFQATIVRGSGAERWAITNWGTGQGPEAPDMWMATPDRLVTTSLFREEWFVLDAKIGGTFTAFRISRNRWVQTNSWDYARVQDRRLYVLQTDPNAARIDIYTLD